MKRKLQLKRENKSQWEKIGRMFMVGAYIAITEMKHVQLWS